MNLFTRPPALEFLESLRRNKQFNRAHVVDAIYVVCWIYDLTPLDFLHVYNQSEWNREIPSTGATYAKAMETARMKLSLLRTSEKGSAAIFDVCRMKANTVRSTLLRLGIDCNPFQIYAEETEDCCE